LERDYYYHEGKKQVITLPMLGWVLRTGILRV
jgi:hypothetical protein